MRPRCEELECREVPGGLSFEGGVISAIGGDGNDTVRVVESGSDYVVTLTTQGVEGVETLRVPMAEAAVIYFVGEGGNDGFYNYTHALSSWAFGGAGNDYLRGSNAADYLDGGDGDDRIWAHAGDDTLLGGAGADFFVADDGDDLTDATGEDQLADW